MMVAVTTTYLLVATFAIWYFSVKSLIGKAAKVAKFKLFTKVNKKCVTFFATSQIHDGAKILHRACYLNVDAKV